jgi:hypothetical protein
VSSVAQRLVGHRANRNRAYGPGAGLPMTDE